MAQIPVRLTVQGMVFPLLSEQCGTTVVDGRGDLTYVPGVSSDGDIPENRGVPGIVYAENVMPSTYGWQSIGYVDLIPPFPAGVTFYEILLVHGATVGEEENAKPLASGLRTYIGAAIISGVTHIYYVDSDGTWKNLYLEGAGPLTASGERLITVATVNGYSYLCVRGAWLGVIDIEAGELRQRTLTGLAGVPRGILSASGHLIAFNLQSVAWSSTVNVEDFVPSDVTGAGGGSVQELAGDIRTAKAAPGGFIIFTDSNCVAAIYTANTAFPFEFRAIPSSGGVDRASHVSDELLNGAFYAITTAGIQRISATGAEIALPNVADFLAAKMIEEWNPFTGQLKSYRVFTELGRRVQVIANRYVILSYAAQDSRVHTHAIVVDTAQNRMGKLKVDSTKFFELHRTQSFQDLDHRTTFGVLGAQGKISRVRFDLDCYTSRGVMIFGRLQYAHQKLTQLQEIRVERACPTDNFVLATQVTRDGTNFLPAQVGYLRPEDEGKFSRRYLFSQVGVSHQIVMSGAFDIHSILVNLNTHGNTASMV